MKTTAVRLGVIAAGFLSTAAFAQTVQQDQQRDVNQQQRIEQGLQSGQLSTREAGRLEREQQHVDKMEAHDLRNGSISPAEQARLNAAENKASHDIAVDKHNGVTGNPGSVSSQRMQADVQRNVNQQQRIANGVNSGALTNREVGSLERGQAHVDRKEANAAECAGLPEEAQRAGEVGAHAEPGGVLGDAPGRPPAKPAPRTKLAGGGRYLRLFRCYAIHLRAPGSHFAAAPLQITADDSLDHRQPRA
jgi:hypothetical protein